MEKRIVPIDDDVLPDGTNSFNSTHQYQHDFLHTPKQVVNTDVPRCCMERNTKCSTLFVTNPVALGLSNTSDSCIPYFYESSLYSFYKHKFVLSSLYTDAKNLSVPVRLTRKNVFGVNLPNIFPM